MAERKRVSFAMRRAMLTGAGASAAIAFAPSRAASADAANYDTFIAVSMKLTGVLPHGIMLLPGNCHSPTVGDEGWCRVAVPAFIGSVSPSI